MNELSIGDGKNYCNYKVKVRFGTLRITCNMKIYTNRGF